MLFYTCVIKINETAIYAFQFACSICTVLNFFFVISENKRIVVNFRYVLVTRFHIILKIFPEFKLKISQLQLYFFLQNLKIFFNQ